MKLKKLLYCTALILVMQLAVSCNKWLELKPLDGIIREEFWNTKEDLNSALIGLYTSIVFNPKAIMDDTKDEKTAEYVMFLWGEIRADMLDDIPGTAVDQRDFNDVTSVNITPANNIIRWSPIYRVINNCNTFLDYAPNVLEKDPTITEAQYNAYIGEALTLRSLMYFYLVRAFKDVPLRLTAVSKDDDIQEIGKADGNVVLDQIISDLKKAEMWVPFSHTATPSPFNMTNDKGRITRLAVHALLADVYLWKEDYGNSLAQCIKVTDYAAANPLRLGLVRAQSNWGSTVFELGSSRETIFELSHRTSVPNIYGPLFSGGAKRFNASQRLSDVFEADDSEDPLKIDVRADATFDSGNSAILKFGGLITSYYNYQIYRYPEVMLMKAEALVGRMEETGDAAFGQQALTIINELRLQRNAADATAPPPGLFDDVTGLYEYILDERSRELAFEGKRWFDVLRHAKRKNYTQNLDYLLSMVSTSVTGSLQQTAINKFRDFNSHYFPIWKDDIFADTKLTQNPFYAN